MNRRERRAAGQKSAHSSQKPAAPTIDALYQAGLGHLQAGRPLDTQICCQQALAIDAGHAGSLHLMGLVSAQAGNHDHAVEWVSRAIRQSPKVEYLSSLGAILQQQGRLEEALQVFDKAVALKPDDAGLWINFGQILEALERPADALRAFQQALALSPHWETAIRCAILLQQSGRLDEALAHFDLGNTLHPDHAWILQARGLCQRGLKRYKEYLADSQRSHACDSNNPDTQNNIG